MPKLVILIFLISLLSCKDNVVDIKNSKPTGIFSETNEITSQMHGKNKAKVHSIKALETLQTSKYVYIKSLEDRDTFWVATSKKEINLGDTYYYKSGLLKTNFESKEHNRVFDTVYLVPNLVHSSHAANLIKSGDTSSKENNESKQESKKASVNVDIPGSTKISDIIANPDEFAGKTIQVSGICTKINPNIMDRNWIHLKDGSADDYDFVLTSNALAKEGEISTFSGKIILDKDFGAGYKYAILLEEAKLVE